MTTLQHQTVLLQPAVDALQIQPDGVYMDGTFGRGGHTREILARLGAAGRLVALDRDPTAAQAAQAIQDERFLFQQLPFSQMEQALLRAEQSGFIPSTKVDGLLLDIGVSSPQIDAAERGFSFMQEGPLDMRMDPTSGISAAQWIAETSEAEMALAFKQWGEERFAKRIAHAIIKQREKQDIVTTLQLASLIEKNVPAAHRYKKHPATRCFQAIRIAVNHELEELAQALDSSISLLRKQGRLVVISFHSLEDRMVKQFMQQQSRGAEIPFSIPLTANSCILQSAHFKIALKKQLPSEDEIQKNVRSRSAVMRVAQKITP